MRCKLARESIMIVAQYIGRPNRDITMKQRLILRVFISQIFFLLSFGFVTSAFAELAANGAITSNYVFRGETQTDDKPAVQGGIDWTHETGFYAGAWGSTLKETCDNRPAGSACGSSNPQGSGLEVDLYGGWTYKFNDQYAMDLGYIIYEYTDSDFSKGTRELYLGLNMGPFRLTYYDGDDQSTTPNDYSYIDFGMDLELKEDVLLSFHYGRRDPDIGKEVNDLRAQVSKAILGFDVALALSYEDGTDNLTTTKDTELYVTVKKVFDLQ